MIYDNFYIFNPLILYSITIQNKKTNEKSKIEIKVIQNKTTKYVTEIKFLRNKKVVQKAIPCIKKETNERGFYLTKGNEFYKEIFHYGYQCYVNGGMGFCLKANENGKVGFCPLSKEDVEEINKPFRICLNQVEKVVEE